MVHTFLIDAGSWLLEGSWLERCGLSTPIKGKTIVSWSRDTWFTTATKLVFPEVDLSTQERQAITMQYRGRLSAGESQFTFVLQHSQLGQVEGEGWIAPKSIFQRYWVLNDRERRSGFESLHRLTDNQYYLSGGLMGSHALISTMEATLERQSS